MTLRLNGSSSGYVELDVPAAAGSHTLTLPDGGGSSGQYLQTNGSGGLSWQTVTDTNTQGYTWLSAVSASGSSVTITGIDTSATDILIGVNGVSGDSHGHLKARVGNGSIDSGSGNYQGGAGSPDYKTFFTSNTEFIFTPSVYSGAPHTWSGHIRLTFVSATSWAMSSVLGTTIDGPVFSAGRYMNSAGLDRIQFYFPSGSFDAGTFRVGYIV